MGSEIEYIVKNNENKKDFDYMRTFKEFSEKLRKIDGEWVLVSKETNRPLQYFDKKPTDKEIDKAEKRINYFKHKG